MAEVFLINKKITVDKPLTGIISKYDKALLQFMTASLITNYNNLLLHLKIAWLLQFSTTVITIYDMHYNSRHYYNSRQIPSYDLFTSARKAVFPAPTATGQRSQIENHVVVSVRSDLQQKSSTVLSEPKFGPP